MIELLYLGAQGRHRHHKAPFSSIRHLSRLHGQAFTFLPAP
ncbi:hypothetical protein [Pseudomarimonas salicorniae]|nr:hypothetical protein [Lysobacter sp. CAU 1642]